MHVTDFVYHVEEYEPSTMPGLFINECWLDVNVQTIGGIMDWDIESIQFETDKGHIIRLKKGNPIFDTLVAAFYADDKLAQYMRDEIAEHV